MSVAITFILFIILILIICFIICWRNSNLSIDGGNTTSDAIYGGSSHTKDLGLKISANPPTSMVMTPPTSMVMTYTISGEDNGLDFSQLRALLKECEKYEIKFIEKPVTEKVNISFGTFKDDAIVKNKTKRWNYDPLFFKQNAAIKNTLGDHHKLINKSELYNTIKKIIPNGIKYLPKSYTVEELEKQFNHSGGGNAVAFPLILKKDKIPQQQGIKIIMSKEEYYKAKKELNITNDAIISEYVANPLLLDGKKMHLRVYYLLSIMSGITRCTVHDEYRIHLANDPYKKEDWLNPDIHISGAISRTKNRRYYWPDDVSRQYDIDLINEKMLKFNKIICMAFTLSNAKNYPESYAGYHIYGADVMITDDFNVYLIEINDRPGFRFLQNEEGWEECSRKFSHRLFSFILNSTILPFFGIVSPPIYEAEFIGNGALTAFGHILTGGNKCYLIPYNYAKAHNKQFIVMAKNIHLFDKLLLFENIINDINSFDIFLIGYLTNLTTVIIGYVILTKQYFIQIVITKEYQNRGIATAIIAQLIEIYYARYFTNYNNYTMYINGTKHVFMYNIANKLQFNEHNHIWEKKCKNHVSIILDKIIHNKLLTYKIISESNIKSDMEVIVDVCINQYMTVSNSQFVHFVYYFTPDTLNILKLSTGSKYNSDFIYKGAELKSSLDIKILNGVYRFKQWYYGYNEISSYFNIENLFGFKKINSVEEMDDDKMYTKYDYTINRQILITKDEIRDDDFSINEHGFVQNLIEEYKMPYLIDGKLICIRYNIVIYVSSNIIKLFCFDKTQAIAARESFSISDLNDLNKTKAYYTNIIKITDVEILKLVNNNNNIINHLFIPFFKILLQYDIKPYPESNAGFYEFCIDLKFIQRGGTTQGGSSSNSKNSGGSSSNSKNSGGSSSNSKNSGGSSSSNSKYIPVIHKINVLNFYNINRNITDNIEKIDINKYYQWLSNCVILPHFGLTSNISLLDARHLMPIYGEFRKNIIISKKIQYSIVEKIHLEFNKERTHVQIYYNDDIHLSKNKHIGNLKLHILENTQIQLTHLEIDTTFTKTIEINVIFILINILRAYYAPLQMFLLLKYEKKMNDIAFELEFSKKGDYYIKKCKI